MAVGALHYTDRTYEITAVPAALAGASLIRTPNSDKRNTSTNLLSFSLSQEAAVYVAYDPLATALPAWLSGWQKLPETVRVNDSKVGNMDLYSKVFPAGQVVLGGNLASPASGSSTNYFVIAKATAVTSPSGTGCPLLSPMPCDQLQVALPFSLSFSGPVSGTVPDKSSAGTGFTLVDAYSGARHPEDGSPANPSLPGHEPARLSLSGGRLQLTTNKGIAWLTNNNQLNTLGVRVDSRARLNAAVTVVSPYSGTGSQQAGLWFGLNDKTYLKLVAVGGKVELRRETNDASPSSDQRLTGAIAGISSATVRLRMLIDPGSATAEGFYSLNGGAEQSVGAPLSISGMGITSSTAHAGIFATHRNGSTPVTYTFDDFSVTKPSTSESLRPYVTAVRPADGATNVALDKSVSVDLMFPSGASLDGNTVNTNTVKLHTVSGSIKTEVTGTSVNSTAAGDAITLTASLAAGTTYEFSISAQVKDLNGYAMIPFVSRFTTTSSSPQLPADLSGVAFKEQVLIDNDFGSDGFTTLVIGPDRKLYATTSGGKIERWDIRSDGTLANHVTISPFGTSRRLLVGLRFDPGANASNLVAWITHSSPEFLAAPDWSGQLSRINLNNPSSPQVKDYLINLPRSYKDHSVFSIDFGPDGALYFTCGSNTAMGSPSLAWGDRPERLLSATILRLDIAKANLLALPIDVKTEAGGSYNPYATNAPLTLYATGLRNAYDLVWHTNGQLYVPTNGSAAGGNTPALLSGAIWSNGQAYTGPTVPAMKDVRDTQGDYLYRVVKGGYYGHPNVLRNEYILNGGNPTSQEDPAEIVWTINGKEYGYPVGTPKEPNFRGWAYDFGLNISPNGIIEYKSSTFSGKLKGKMLVCRFSGGDDVMLLEPGGTSKDIIRAVEGSLIPGFRRPFANPLDIIEDVATGNLYLSEYFDGNGDGRPRITLLRVDESGAPTVTNKNLINAGGPKYIDTQQRTWNEDVYSTGGVIGSKSFDVAGTTDDQLYLKYRFASQGANFSYHIPAPESKNFTVKLHFLEPYYGAPGGKTYNLTGARVFHVDLEGKRVISNYDIYSQDGAGKAIVKTFNNVAVLDGILTIDFISVNNNAIISAIELIPQLSSTASLQSMPSLPTNKEEFSGDTEATLQVYPNPATGPVAFIELRGFSRQAAIKISVADISGRTLFEEKVIADANGNHHLPLQKMTRSSSLPPGLYIVTAQSNAIVKTKMFVIEW
ncbi:malectin domain-containing carbohydrate-binding protein [Pontibacter sp. CAU 1760]